VLRLEKKKKEGWGEVRKKFKFVAGKISAFSLKIILNNFT